MREQAGRTAAQLEHAAVFYAAEDEYLDEVLGFVGAGLDHGDLVFVAVPGPEVGLLREHLRGRAGQVTFADMTQMGANPAWIIPRVQAFLDAHPGRQVRYRERGAYPPCCHPRRAPAPQARQRRSCHVP
jgi:hypothetical protein